jgi:hypothetical protein
MASIERSGRHGGRVGWGAALVGPRAAVVWLSGVLFIGLFALAVWLSLPPVLRLLPGSFGADQPADFSSNPQTHFAPQRPAGSANQPNQPAQTNP